MGRWGHCIFECDQDLDLVSDISFEVAELSNLKEPVEFFTDNEDELSALRKILDNGVSDILFTKYLNTRTGFYKDYPAIILCMLCMFVGAHIKDDVRSKLLGLCERLESKHGYQSPLSDEFLRDQGKVQVMAALEHYKNDGKPRETGPSCFHCGKVANDIGKASLQECKRCKVSDYCDDDCQKADWKKHELICYYSEDPPFMLNV